MQKSSFSCDCDHSYSEYLGHSLTTFFHIKVFWCIITFWHITNSKLLLLAKPPIWPLQNCLWQQFFNQWLIVILFSHFGLISYLYKSYRMSKDFSGMINFLLAMRVWTLKSVTSVSLLSSFYIFAGKCFVSMSEWWVMMLSWPELLFFGGILWTWNLFYCVMYKEYACRM